MPLLAACGAGPRTAGGEPSVDTLPGGGLHVRTGAAGLWALERMPPWRVEEELRPFDFFTVAADGTLWVRRRLGDETIGLDVFAADGRYLGQADVPPDFGRITAIHHITADAIYAVMRDELDVQYVVRFGIRRPQRR